jgi:phosphatidylserine decarboxylase
MDADWSTNKTTHKQRAAQLSDYLSTLLQYLLPQRFITWLAYRLTRSRTAWFKNFLIRAFIDHFKVDMTEAEESDPTRYRDFNHFFTRPLRPDVRPLAVGDGVLCCPVDGVVSQVGVVDDDTLFQAKNRTFSLTQLLGGDATMALPFRHGSFVSLYLSPRDYHRVHMPTRGRLQHMTYIPGQLFSVSPATTRLVPNLFARNERVATFFDTAAGSMALVLVGAINVASIETVWTGVMTPPRGKQIRHWDYSQTEKPSMVLDKGAEMGRFNMGSTVIILFAKKSVLWDATIIPETMAWMGQRLGEIKQDLRSSFQRTP